MVRLFLKQAQKYFLSWARNAEFLPDLEDCISIADDFFPKLLSESDENDVGIAHLISTEGPEWLLEIIIRHPGIYLGPDRENGWNPAHRAAYFGNMRALKTLYSFDKKLFHLTDLTGATAVDFLTEQSLSHCDFDTNISQEDIWKVYHNEQISSGALKSEPVELSRLPEDVTIKCIDGEIKANNLVLLARSEYFRAMFGAGVSWKESSSLKVELEVQVDIMRSFVEFCYTDELPTASEYIGQLLVLSDRFLAQSLRSKCENALAIVLDTEICPKLAMSLFGFALETGAHYLASKCAKILVPNLVVLLETGGIDALGLDELEALSVFYKNEVFAQIERKMNENEEIELWDAEVLQELVKECKFVMKSPKQRRASRKISEKSELTSPNTPITPLKELSESLESSYITPKSKSRPQRTKLDLTSPKVLSPSSPKSWGEVASPRRRSGSFSLKDIIEEEAKTTTPTRPVKIKGAFTPIRRKHAKGQDMLREERERAQQAASFSPQSPWGKARPVKIPDPCIGDPFPSPSTSFHVKSPIQFSPSPTVSKTDRLDEIIRKQSAAEQNRKKVKSKSLKTINIEERAIEELKAMYAEKFPYDIITVKRAHLDVSAPVWTKS
ncbi:unnamed protein product [Oikopleura dioica]|uniref:BTB domain-containing protein n=1 Tax=Oikopleura dioica TaxID=34765 RepID=E4YH27_OIKDI|nr:unnamed protein product [Oikopleura dioica]